MQVHFGSFALDLPSRELRRGEEIVHLSPKAFQLLTTLIEQRPRAIAKKELQDLLWPSTFVLETNLANVVAELRAALQDDSRKPQFIRTVYAFGYAFSGEVRGEPARPPALPAVTAAMTKQRWRPVASLVFIFFLTALSMKSSHREVAAQSRGIHSIAVLPFKVSSPVASDQYFGIGMADVITTRLSGLRDIAVRPTSAVTRFDTKGHDAIAAGEQLRVDAVLDGTVRRAGDRVRVTVQLFTIADRRALWGQSFDEHFTEAFRVEDAVAERVTSALALKLSDDERRLLAKRRPVHPEAYRQYIAGRYILMKVFSSGGKESIPHFEAAIRHDPSYAPAYAGLSQAYAKLAIFNESSPAPLWEKAAAAGKQALAIDQDLSAAHAALGVVAMHLDWDWETAEKRFKRAIEVNPSDAMAHRYYAMLLQAKGRFDEAVVRRELALQLDPMSLSVQWELGWTFYLARRFPEAVHQHGLILKLEPGYFRSMTSMGHALMAQMRTAEALEVYRRAVSFSGEHMTAAAWLARAEALAGKREEGQRLLRDLERLSGSRYVSPYQLATVHAALGEKDRACALLELAAEHRSSALLNVAVDPAFDTLRKHSRFAALIERLRLR